MSKPPANKAPAKRRKPTRPTYKPKVAKLPEGGPKIDSSKVELVQHPRPKDRGDGAGGEYSDVMVDGVRAGALMGALSLIEVQLDLLAGPPPSRSRPKPPDSATLVIPMIALRRMLVMTRPTRYQA